MAENACPRFAAVRFLDTHERANPSSPENISWRVLADIARVPSLQRNFDERAFVFLCDVIAFVRTVRPESGVRRLVDQVVAAAGSVAANRQEAAGASSRRELIRFNEIALRSANETVLPFAF